MKMMIVAMDEQNAIGNKGKLPWHLSTDLKHFKEITYGNNVVMGRKTFESIGKPLACRHNIVLTRRKDLHINNVEVRNGLQGLTRYVIIGGGEIYRKYIDKVDILFVTRVHTKLSEYDATFPIIEESKWKLVESEFVPKGENDDYDMTFEVYDRIK